MVNPHAETMPNMIERRRPRSLATSPTCVQRKHTCRCAVWSTACSYSHQQWAPTTTASEPPQNEHVLVVGPYPAAIDSCVAAWRDQVISSPITGDARRDVAAADRPDRGRWWWQLFCPSSASNWTRSRRSSTMTPTLINRSHPPDGDCADQGSCVSARNVFACVMQHMHSPCWRSCGVRGTSCGAQVCFGDFNSIISLPIEGRSRGKGAAFSVPPRAASEGIRCGTWWDMVVHITSAPRGPGPGARQAPHRVLEDGFASHGTLLAVNRGRKGAAEMTGRLFGESPAGQLGCVRVGPPQHALASPWAKFRCSLARRCAFLVGSWPGFRFRASSVFTMQ